MTAAIFLSVKTLIDDGALGGTGKKKKIFFRRMHTHLVCVCICACSTRVCVFIYFKRAQAKTNKQTSLHTHKPPYTYLEQAADSA